jgi:hypothetical protein
MRLSPSWLLVPVLLTLAACQSVDRAGTFEPQCVPRAVDAGICELPTNFRLFGALLAER